MRGNFKVSFSQNGLLFISKSKVAEWEDVVSKMVRNLGVTGNKGEVRHMPLDA